MCDGGRILGRLLKGLAVGAAYLGTCGARYSVLAPMHSQTDQAYRSPSGYILDIKRTGLHVRDLPAQVSRSTQAPGRHELLQGGRGVGNGLRRPLATVQVLHSSS